MNIAPAFGVMFAYWFKLHKHQLGKYIFFLLLVSFSIETMVEIHYQLRLGHNVFFNSIANIINLSIISSLIYDFTGKKKQLKSLALFSLALVVFFLAFVEGFFNYAPIAYSLEEVSVIVLCFYYFYHVFQYEEEVLIMKNPVFIMICGVFVYHCGSLFTSIMILRITESLDSYILYDLQLVLDGCMNFGLILMLIYIYLIQKRTAQPPIKSLSH